MSSKNTDSKADSQNTQETSPEKGDVNFLDQTLRPAVWADYIGQKNIKDNLQILLTAAAQRKHPTDHFPC